MTSSSRFATAVCALWAPASFGTLLAQTAPSPQEVSAVAPASGSAVGAVTPPAGDPGHEELAPRAWALPLEGDVRLDGRLDEAIWRRAPAATRFTQLEPEEGEAATQRTEVRFAYDETHLYVGARMYDDRGADGVTSRLVRRDGDTESDRLTLSFDTFLDHQGRTVFSVNPAGVRGDAYGPAGSFPDESWDPVWRAETRIDSLGWTAELEIPFNQLRFARGLREWGLQIEREVNRRNEYQMWSFWRQDQSGGPSRYGHLEGIQPPASTTGLEVLPYTVAQLDVAGDVDPRDPFARERESTVRMGADVKYLLTSNLTVNATINPDFGQAEVDPAVVNLSAFETFFPEKREFFIEGRGVFSFGNFWCKFCSNTSSLSMLFTRRIGRSPQAASLARAAGGWADIPEATTILGAAKVTGQLADGTSVGVLNATTARERAEVVDAEGNRSRVQVEPLSNYFVGRAKKDFLDGDLQIGGIATSVIRDLGDPALEERLNSHSEGFGVDAEWWWGDRTYHWLFSGAVTNVAGSEEAMLRVQRSSARYFQRPDREHGGNGLFTDRFDPTLTSMRGYGLYSRIAKDAGDWGWETALNVRSPGFENNDIAFLTRTDFIWMNANVARQWTEPTGWFRNIWTTVGAQQQFNFDGDLTDRQLHGFFSIQTPFYWNFNVFGIYRPSTLDDRLTRGGPVVRGPDRAFLAANISTDRRKTVFGSLNPSTGWNDEGARDWSIGARVTVKPSSNVSLEVGPRFSRSESTEQYVTAVDDPTAGAFFGRRYVFSDLEQKTLSMETRLNWTFSPTMSLELFAQPFLSSNDFSRYKEFEAPRERGKSVYGEDVGTIREEVVLDAEGNESRRVHVDPDGSGPAEEFSFADRDFNFRSLRGNLVFRWEYVPGSTLFFVWTQDRSASEAVGNLDVGRDVDALFGAPSDNIFLVKVTYWLGL